MSREELSEALADIMAERLPEDLLTLRVLAEEVRRAFATRARFASPLRRARARCALPVRARESRAHV